MVLVRPSVQKRKMFNVYFYTDISLAVAVHCVLLCAVVCSLSDVSSSELVQVRPQLRTELGQQQLHQHI